jgi:two-component system OmpR family response regulator
MLVLVIEDDPIIGKSIQKSLSESGYECEWIKDGAQGLAYVRAQKWDVVVLDLVLPNELGLAILEKVRREGIQTPILILSALGTVPHKVQGLALGADDYLAKPFEMAELHARIEAVSRRACTKPAVTLEAVDLHLDLATRRVNTNNMRIDLTPTEFSILEMLMRHAGSVVTRKMMCESLWQSDWEGTTNVIEVHINRLRSKLEKGRKEPLIHTIRGRGYALRAASNQPAA